ncbi:hypothetical protein X798_03128 [Onchocerca flexuosa]|uniref:Uncharacterized protein n=1 Tax=Onchocerca flexuosa TaxID=387005 RepID=A0A238BY76_9BILA|nr:hypothetical protein X798_03128 [Onchocerca flexuosa]
MNETCSKEIKSSISDSNTMNFVSVLFLVLMVAFIVFSQRGAGFPVATIIGAAIGGVLGLIFGK